MSLLDPAEVQADLDEVRHALAGGELTPAVRRQVRMVRLGFLAAAVWAVCVFLWGAPVLIGTWVVLLMAAIASGFRVLMGR